MAERISETFQKKLSDRLAFYDDLGIQLFYRDRGAVAIPDSEPRLEPSAMAQFSTPRLQKEQTLPKPAGKPTMRVTAAVATPLSPKIASLPVAAGPSLFESVDKIAGDTLLKVREDLGECTRCKLHSTRHTIVFGDGNPKAQLVIICVRSFPARPTNGNPCASSSAPGPSPTKTSCDGNPKAQLVFVGEGPGADEDAQGLPFVGRAGKLLTQMIEAMGLQRNDVY